MMDNATRRQLLNRHRSSGFTGSIIDVFKAYEQGIDLIGQYEQQMQVARTQQEQQQGLRPQHQAGNTNASMAFPNQPPNASFNTVGMKAPIDMKQYDDKGNLVMSYEKVPPGVTDLKMSSKGGTVIETPAKMQSGGVKLPPYYASSKNDPRYIAYNDSLNLNLATLEQDRLMGPGSYKVTDNIDYWTPEQLQDARTPKYNAVLGYDIAEDYQNQNDQFQDEDGDGKIDYNLSARREDEQLINYYKSLGFTDDNIMYHSSPDLVHPTIKPSHTYFDGTAESPYYAAPKQEVILSSKLSSIQPKQIPTSTPAPELQIPKIPRYLNSTPIYQQDPSVSKGQYQIGENIWDPNKKQWFRSMFDKEMQGTFRENAIPRKEKWRTIETPPGGFKYGGVRKYQSGGLYNYDRAMELGYEPDKFGHLPSVDDQNGMWLKSSKHPTAVKELLHGYLGSDHYKTHNLITNPEGHFGKDQLQYVPKQNMQFGGPKAGPRVPEMSDAEMSLKIIQEANAGNPAARRMRSDYGQRMFLPGETDPSTHYMASFDNYAVPTVQEDYIGGPLSYNPNPAPSKADFKFDTPEQAAYFAKNYKQASAAKAFQQKNGGIKKYQTGGQADTLYVNTPDHPRIQQYADSSYAYDMGLQGKAKAIAESQKLLDEYNSRNNFTGAHKAFGQTSSINTNTSNTIRGLQPSSTQKINYMAPAPYDPSINVPVKIPVPGPNTFQSGMVYSLWDKPKQPVVYRPELQQMDRINPSPINQSAKASLQPVGKYINNTRPSQTIYKQDPSVSTGQYPIGEYLWDSNSKRWKTDTWDPEMQKASRQLAIPRGYQTGGTPKWQDTIDDINKNHGPDQLGDTLDLNTLDLISIERMGVKNPEATLDTIVYHETGPDQPMLSNAVQLVGPKSNYREGTGKGEFMYDKPSTLRDANRVEDIAQFMGMETPQFALDLQKTEGTSRADTLTSDQQRMLMLSNLIMDNAAPFRAYGRGDVSIEDLWYKGVNRRTEEQDARQDFRNSMIRLQGDDIDRYKVMGPRPNYFGRYAPVEKYQNGGMAQDNTRVSTPLPPTYNLNSIQSPTYRDQGTIRQAPDEVETMSWYEVAAEPLKALKYYQSDSNRGSLPTRAEWDATGGNAIDAVTSMYNPASVASTAKNSEAGILGINALKGTGSLSMPPNMSRDKILKAMGVSSANKMDEARALKDYADMQIQGLTLRGRELDKNFGNIPTNRFLSNESVEYLGNVSGRPVVGIQMPDQKSPLHYYLSTGLAGKRMQDGSSSMGNWVPFPGWSDNYVRSFNTPTQGWFNKAEGWDRAYGSSVMQNIGKELTPHLAQRYFGEEAIRRGQANQNELFKALGLASVRRYGGNKY